MKTKIIAIYIISTTLFSTAATLVTAADGGGQTPAWLTAAWLPPGALNDGEKAIDNDAKAGRITLDSLAAMQAQVENHPGRLDQLCDFGYASYVAATYGLPAQGFSAAFVSLEPHNSEAVPRPLARVIYLCCSIMPSPPVWTKSLGDRLYAEDSNDFLVSAEIVLDSAPQVYTSDKIRDQAIIAKIFKLYPNSAKAYGVKFDYYEDLVVSPGSTIEDFLQAISALTNYDKLQTITVDRSEDRMLLKCLKDLLKEREMKHDIDPGNS